MAKYTQKNFTLLVLTIVVLVSAVLVLLQILTFTPYNISVGFVYPNVNKFVMVRKKQGDYLKDKPLVDESSKWSYDQLLEDIKKSVPNLPGFYFKEEKVVPISLKNGCAVFPSLGDLEFSNIYWQMLYASFGNFYLYNAFLDTRPKIGYKAIVRILGMIDRNEPTTRTCCQFWFKNKLSPVIVKSLPYNLIWNTFWKVYDDGVYQPYLISCVLPKKYENSVPISVSLVERPCDNATNNLKIIYDVPKHGKTKKKDFGVCVKGLLFPREDLSVRLAEWIEMIQLVGGDKVYLYTLQAHQNITKVLSYYEEKEMVSNRMTTLAGGRPNQPSLQYLYVTKMINYKRLDEILLYNDCFYRNMYKYRHIAFFDIDEIIIPVKHKNWKDMMEEFQKNMTEVQKKTTSSYCARNVYFLDSHRHKHNWFEKIPKYMHMLQHVYRSKEASPHGEYMKCFHDTKIALTLHNHFPMECFPNKYCITKDFPTSLAQLHHYRSDCGYIGSKCENIQKTSVMDTSMWKYKDVLIKRVGESLKELGYFNKQQNNDKS